MLSLEDLYRLHIGKKSDKWSSYLEFYDNRLSSRRNRPVRVLEIGIQNGGSLEIWAKYFPEAISIIGCDINEKCRHLVFDDPRISIVVGDVNDPRVVSEISSHSEAFDVIIDDGSHRSGDVIKTFSLYFQFVAEGGLYVAEDLHCSYWKEYQGGIEDEASSLSFFRRLIDYLNYEHWVCAVQPLDMLSHFSNKWGARFCLGDLSKIGEITFRNSLVAISKNPVSKNRLGTRIIAGSTSFVSELSPQLHGTMLRPPSQKTNPLKKAVNLWIFALLTILSLVTRYLSIRLSARYKRSAEKYSAYRNPRQDQ